MPAVKNTPAADNATDYKVPADIAALIVKRDARAAQYATVETDFPGSSEPQLRARRAAVSQECNTLDARITKMLLDSGGPSALVASGFKPYTSPAANPVSVTPPDISDDDLIANLADWTRQIAELPAGFESVAHRFDKDHVQPLLAIARDRDSLKVDGSTVTVVPAA